MNSSPSLLPGALALVLAAATWTAAPAQESASAAVTTPVDLGGFGSDDPVARKDEPTRGVIKFGPKDHLYMPASHWEQFDWKFTAKRWGTYQVRLTYTLRHASLATQLKLGEQRLKKLLFASSDPKQVYLGEIFVDKPGQHEFSLYTPSSGAGAGFTIHEVAFVPAAEGDPIRQAADGSITLLAKDATTWSENMRYEPKPEKNCLGYWTEADDFAEWEFEVTKPGKYKVTVFQGCGGGNEGSEVAVRHGEQSLKFTVKDTGGFQKWADVMVGEIEIKGTGVQRLVIDPETKKKAAVLDVQKVVLTPVG